MIDFDKVNVWSIERDHIDGNNVTVVGVLEQHNDKGVILTKSREYRYNTNSDGHKRIIAAYEVHMAKKEKKK
jgi:peroxiredoxin